MLDVTLYGMDAGPHHVTNLLIHIASTLLLFVLLQRMTREDGPSAFVAALFAVHPLHVESVAWLAERKDVLSSFFLLVTIWTYVRYVERPGTGRYLAVAGAYALALMSKPMVVTLPFALLLLDVWPLRRLGKAEDPAFRSESRPSGLPGREGAAAGDGAGDERGDVRRPEAGWGGRRPVGAVPAVADQERAHRICRLPVGDGLADASGGVLSVARHRRVGGRRRGGDLDRAHRAGVARPAFPPVRASSAGCGTSSRSRPSSA